MCSYCGCEAEAVVAGLMADHSGIADLAYQIIRALDDQRPDETAVLTSRLAEAFHRHSLHEEAGLFAQLRAAGEALEEIDALVRDHRRLRPALSDNSLAADPKRLRLLLAELTRHAQIEDNDLFPFAMQRLPDRRWDALASEQSLLGATAVRQAPTAQLRAPR